MTTQTETLKSMLALLEKMKYLVESMLPDEQTVPLVMENIPQTLTTFKTLIRSGDYVILDTETTGLDSGEICQIAIINSAGNVILDTLVKTANPIPPDASRIHGIYDEDVVDSPTWPLLMPRVREILTGCNVVVYNAVYDRKMLHKTNEAWKLDKVEWKEFSRWWCAMEMFAEVYGDWNDYRKSFRWQKLVTAARYYNLPTEGAHTALADCQMTLGVVKAMCD